MTRTLTAANTGGVWTLDATTAPTMVPVTITVTTAG